MSNQVIKDKVTIITGAASGIGLAIAERFTTDGAKVVINDINVDAGQSTAKRLDALFVASDLSTRANCQALIEQTTAQFGTIDILVNNAGFQHIDAIDAFPEDTWDKMIALMLTAPFLLTRYAWPFMKQNGWGRIINIASVHAVRASPFKSAYISAKHGLMGLTRTTALEGGPHGITVHAICPAYVQTPLVENQITAQARTRGLSEKDVIEQVMLKPAAIKRLVQPNEVAALAAFLCSNEASAMTGSPLMIDLGWTAG